ncbi:flagellar basal body-associated FliL family protein [Dickeya solani]|uniref:Sel1 repeat family protein n=1 Tax=Dickeya solani TaxID=1089444 RepID=A0ABU4EJZ6_9GAMM|nr:hypothetical protein [Dickeya solani]MCA6999742.1 hypothetical protein [Dickeya solani]MCZ0820313.1 hypothetical protein [Dickeya solani]MDV6993953.1 hypothetical protein [Dickeya solani]MDV7005309.1 hypothetical protein [Dickeya solani]MDV7039126.1 hypothetical protein [Dickeya solani]
MLIVELKPLQQPKPGYARLLLRQWQGSVEGLKLSLQRNQDHLFLDNHGQWAGHQIWHEMVSFEELDETIYYPVGPDMVDALVASQSGAFKLTLSDGSDSDYGVMRIARDIQSSPASGTSVPLDTVRASQPEPVAEVSVSLAPEPPVAMTESAPGPLDTPSSEPVPTSRAPLPWVVSCVVALLLVLGIGGWLFMGKDKPAETVSVPASAAATPCSPQQMAALNGMEFVKGCMKTQPSSTQLQDIINQAKTSKHCDIAQRLYAYKAQSGDVGLAINYAREYDPDTAVAGGCFTADAATAIYWYEAVLQQDPHNSVATSRLAALKK